MAAPARGLTPTDLTAIREAIAAGRRPKVVFTSSAGQMAGNPGHVVELTDPSESDEWIVVQFGRDQLPFSPTDLAMPIRATAARRTEPTPQPRTRARVDKPTVPTPRKEAAVTAATVGTAPSPTATPKQPPPPPKPAEPTSRPAATPPKPVTTMPTDGPARTEPKRPAKPKLPATFVVTLTYADREWMVAANQGSKALAKPYVIKPAEALRMVALIDVPGVHDAVENIIAAERAEAEQRAVRLREELAEIESRLSELSR